MSLPFGARVPDQIGEGHATSAPAKPMLWRKAMITTGLSAVLFVIVYIVIDSGVISFRPD